MAVIVQPVPMFTDNYAWMLRDEASGAVGIVDPADADAASEAVETAGGRLDVILLTHHHDDHVAGTDAVRARYGCRVVGAVADAHRLPRLDQAVREGDVVSLGDARGRVIETPGHTQGHISIYFADGGALFCADTLFSVGCGRLLEGSAEEMFASLGKLAALPDATLVFCGHEYTASNVRFALSVDGGNAALQARAAEVAALREDGRATVPSGLGQERAVNPFLRARDAAELGRLRAAKDRF